MLDVRIYEIGYSFLRQIGTTPPSQFTMFNLSPALIASLGANAQNLINQLIASGGINAANSQSISALLAQLQNSSQNSLLSTPFATFGGGLTTFAVTGGTGASFTLSLNTSDIRSLDHVLMRASQNDAAVLKLGQRYPIVNATFAPIYNTSAISSVLGNQSYIAPFPSFQFEDLGLNLKATPIIHADRDVSLKLEMQVRSLGSQNVNGIPIINNREYSGYITLKNGESGVVAGLVTKDDIRSMAGLPFLARVPALTYAAAQSTKTVTEDELMLVITPHILRMPEDKPVAIEMPTDH
jgi:Flp pilus assembly secretin CpaC